mmetsp:Transcript_141457/g.260697  ORF Transcript_141457/g.260697 Transcript_141457/m.260697 type:complete len:158 (+) Transcript_141457:35-508(+)
MAHLLLATTMLALVSACLGTAVDTHSVLLASEQMPRTSIEEHLRLQTEVVREWNPTKAFALLLLAPDSPSAAVAWNLMGCNIVRKSSCCARCSPAIVMGRQRGKDQGSTKNKKYTKSNLPSKQCVQCGRPFDWRKKWEKVWDEVKYCSERCRREAKR